MGYFAEDGITVWQKGQNLTAEDLNRNFATLLMYAERAIDRALQPDVAVVELTRRLRDIESRLDALELHASRSARERNEMEYTPLAYFGGMLQRLDGLQQMTEATAAELRQAHSAVEAMHNDQRGRIERLEQQPPAARADALAALIAEYQGTTATATKALLEATALRGEVAHAKRLALATDREANRQQYAPLAVLAELIKRIEALEAR